jgi:hypothetical protein
MSASPEERTAQFNAAVVQAPASYSTPFTVREWVGSGDEGFTNCLHWPSPKREESPVIARPPLVPPTVPVLVLNSDLDSVTPLGGALQVVARMGPSTRLITIPNTTHVAALADPYDCASAIVRHFFADPSSLGTLDTSCTSTIPELRAVGDFPSTTAKPPAGMALAGNAADLATLRLGAVGIEAAGDALARIANLTTSHGVGLHGGTYDVASSEINQTLTLHGVRWTSDATTDGTIVANQFDGVVSGSLHTVGDTGRAVDLTVSWPGYTPLAQPEATGTASGDGATAVVHFRMPAHPRKQSRVHHEHALAGRSTIKSAKSFVGLIQREAMGYQALDRNRPVDGEACALF